VTSRRVWAPHARRVELVAAGRAIPLAPAGGGWHAIELDGVMAAADYRYSLDGGPPLADPRSPFQPRGISGESRPVDHGAFAWAHDTWHPTALPDAVLYELHVGTFTSDATFEAVLTKLGHLRGLGVTAIELMPVAEFPGRRGWGYDGVLPYAPHHAYGGPDGLKRLIDGCHARDIAVLIDVVYNHLGPSGNVLPRYGPYLTDRHHTPWGEAMNFDGPGSEEVRRFVIDNALMWLTDYRADGLRLDAVHAIIDDSPYHLLAQLAAEVRNLSARLDRRMWLIAESEDMDTRIVTSREDGGFGLDAIWNEEFHHAVHARLTGERQSYYAPFGSTTDVASIMRGHRSGAVAARSCGAAPSGHELIGFAQNHDQVGNRPLGDRSTAVLSPAATAIAASLVCCAPFVPMLFQGEEWGASTPFLYFTDHDDPAMAEAVTEGRRREFAAFGTPPDDIPDPQDPLAWRRSRLDWGEVSEPRHAELLEWHRRLLALRHEEHDLTDGRWACVDVSADGDALVLRRGSIVVALNLGAAPTRVDVGDGATLMLAWPAGAHAGGRLSTPVQLGSAVDFRSEGVAILRR